MAGLYSPHGKECGILLCRDHSLVGVWEERGKQALDERLGGQPPAPVGTIVPENCGRFVKGSCKEL